MGGGQLDAWLVHRSKKDRSFSECFFEEEDGDKFCSGSSRTAGGRGRTQTLGTVQFNQDPAGDGDSFVPYSFALHAFDFQEFFVLTAPFDRTNISFNGFIDLSNGIRRNIIGFRTSLSTRRERRIFRRRKDTVRPA